MSLFLFLLTNGLICKGLWIKASVNALNVDDNVNVSDSFSLLIHTAQRESDTGTCISVDLLEVNATVLRLLNVRLCF